MGIWDTLTNIFTGAPATNAAAQNAQLYRQAQNTGTANIGQGVASSESALQNARNVWGDFGNTFSGRYSPAVSTYLGALGVNGPAGVSKAQSAFQTSPGYDFSQQEALKAVERAGYGRGAGFSGNTLQACRLSGCENRIGEDGHDCATRICCGYSQGVQ